MTDKNGREMKTGDDVVITGAFFKNDNGLYRIIHSPGDGNWLGKDCYLRKLNKDRTESKSKYNITFWPLMAFTNNHSKNMEARKHNAEHAQIEVVA